MSGNDCRVLFPLGRMAQQGVPAEIQDYFQGVAKRSGKVDEVDSCDLASFYDEHSAPSDERLTLEVQFLETTHDASGYARLSFGFTSLFRHLAKIQFERIGETLRAELREHPGDGTAEKFWQEEGRMTAPEMVKKIPSKLRNGPFGDRLRQLAGKYPVWLVYKENSQEALFGHDLDVSFACAMFVCVPLGGYVVASPMGGDAWVISEVTPQWQATVTYYDPVDREAYWIKLDLSHLLRTDLNPYGLRQVAYRSFRKKYTGLPEPKIGTELSPQIVSTNFTHAALDRYSKMLSGVRAWTIPFFPEGRAALLSILRPYLSGEPKGKK